MTTIIKEQYTIMTRDVRNQRKSRNNSRQLLDDYVCNTCSYKAPRFSSIVKHVRSDHL